MPAPFEPTMFKFFYCEARASCGTRHGTIQRMCGQVHRKHESWDNLDSKRATTGGEGRCYNFSPPGEEVRSAHHIRWLKALPSEMLALDHVRRERSPPRHQSAGVDKFHVRRGHHRRTSYAAW